MRSRGPYTGTNLAAGAGGTRAALLLAWWAPGWLTLVGIAAGALGGAWLWERAR